MKKCSKYFLLISLLFIPTLVFASSGDDSVPIAAAILTEAIISIHMSIFVLIPISDILTNDGSKKLFWKLFIARAVILIIFDLFITTRIVVVDGVLLFIGAFILVPILMLITKRKSYQTETYPDYKKPTYDVKATTNVNQINTSTCPKCGNILGIDDKFCSVCGTAHEVNNNQSSPQQKVFVNYLNFDPIFNNDEDEVVEAFIDRELIKAGVKKGLTSREVLIRKNILNVIFSILIFVYVSLIFFHFPLYTYIIGAIILYVYFIATNKYNLTRYLEREVMSRPNEKISNIVMNIKSSLVSDYSNLFELVLVLIAVVSSLVVFSKPRILYEKTEGGYAVRFYAFGLSNYKTAVIPDTYKGEKVVSLRGNTFSNMPYLKSVELPDTIIEIRGQAFKNDSNLTSVNIPSNLEYLGGGAFYGCSSITSIILPDTLTYMGGEVFYKASSLKHVKLSNSLSEIRGDSFEYCTSLKSITIPDSVERIGGHAFYGDIELVEVIFSANSRLNEIGSSAFRQCNNLYSITIPSGVYVNERAFKESPTSVKYFE